MTKTSPKTYKMTKIPSKTLKKWSKYAWNLNLEKVQMTNTPLNLEEDQSTPKNIEKEQKLPRYLEKDWYTPET